MPTKLLLLSLLLIPFVDGFVTTTSSASIAKTNRNHLRTVALQESQKGNDPWDFINDDSSFDVEAARRQLESLVGGGPAPLLPMRPSPSFRFKRPSTSAATTSSFSNDSSKTPSSAISPPLDVILPPAPPMTTLERGRRMAEQELLAKLTNGDEALTDLWDLWFQERGAGAAARLTHAEELTGQGPRHWDEAEAILSSLIEEHGVYWAEPVNRLATLYYMQGRLDESETLCQMVLAVKPWHFGALSGIVMVYASLHDSEKARQWAARRLPTFAPTGPNRRRRHWVETALKDSRSALDEGEQRNSDWMGPKDDYEALNDAWQ